MRIDDATIHYVAELAKLELSDETQDVMSSLTRERARQDLSRILDYIEKMDERNTDEIEPGFQAFSPKNVVREDEPEKPISREEILRNAPLEWDGCFVVPKTVEPVNKKSR